MLRFENSMGIEQGEKGGNGRCVREYNKKTGGIRVRGYFTEWEMVRLYVASVVFVFIMGYPLNPHLKIGVLFMVGVSLVAIYLLAVEFRSIVDYNRKPQDGATNKETSAGTNNYISIYGLQQLAKQDSDVGYQSNMETRTDAILDVLLCVDDNEKYQSFFEKKEDILYVIEDATIQSLEVSGAISDKIKEITKKELETYSTELVAARNQFEKEEEELSKQRVVEIEKNLEQSIKEILSRGALVGSVTGEPVQLAQELDEYIKNIRGGKAS